MVPIVPRSRQFSGLVRHPLGDRGDDRAPASTARTAAAASTVTSRAAPLAVPGDRPPRPVPTDPALRCSGCTELLVGAAHHRAGGEHDRAGQDARAPGDATQLEQARRWAEQGVRGQEIARRPDVSDTMISRLVGAHRRRPTLTPLIKAGLVVLWGDQPVESQR